MSPTVAVEPTDDDESKVILTVAADIEYSNNTNKSESDEFVRHVTENIVNNYVDQIVNKTDDTRLIVVIAENNNEHDILLTSNYTTNNITAVYLKALFETELEKEILGLFYCLCV